MARYFIESVQCGIGEGGFACGPVDGPIVAEAKIRTDMRETFFMSLAEVTGIPNFYKSPVSTFDLQINEDMDDEQLEEFQGYFIDTGEYGDIFENQDPEWFQLYRYLIYIVRTDRETCEAFQKATTGKYLDEIDIPASDVEEDYMDEYDEEDEDGCAEFEPVEIPDNREDLYKLRLMLEADVSTESVFHDMDGDAFEQEKRDLQAVIEACESDEDYAEWKESYLNSELANLNGQKIIVCKYLFAGLGQYEAIIPECGLESFKCWINGNGSAFFGGTREATEEEIKTFIALSANK